MSLQLLLNARRPARRAKMESRFIAAQGKIFGPDGNVWVGIGANLGTTSAFDWNGTAKNHAVLYGGTTPVAGVLTNAKDDWGWNFVRLNILGTDQSSFSLLRTLSMTSFLNYLDTIIVEYTSQGFVVMLDPHDDPIDWPGQEALVEDKLATFWTAAATKWKNNPYVWYNLINEPRYQNAAWLAAHRKWAAAVRTAGARAPIVVDAPIAGQDIGTGYTLPGGVTNSFAYEPQMAPTLNREYSNVILSQHVYGGWNAWNSPAKLTTWVNNVRAAGLTPLFGEYGYTYDESGGTVNYQVNNEGAFAVWSVAPALGVTSSVWHGTHGDAYSLAADGEAFYTANPAANINTSDMGYHVWKMTHPDFVIPTVSSVIPQTIPFLIGA